MPSAAEKLKDWLTNGFIPASPALFKTVSKSVQGSLANMGDVEDFGSHGFQVPDTRQNVDYLAMKPKPTVPGRQLMNDDGSVAPVYASTDDAEFNVPPVYAAKEVPNQDQTLSSEDMYGPMSPGVEATLPATPPKPPVGNMPSVSDIPSAVAASWPGFKDQLAQAPQGALNEMAAYEKENPVGSALGFMGNVVAGKTARGFKQAENLGRVFGGAVDALPRFEIADNAAKLKGLPKALQESNLSDVLEHPELFENYPELANLKVKKQIETPFSGGSKGSYNPATGEIMVQAGDDAKSTLLHEIQHAIQEKEDFARGGSPNVQGRSLEGLHKYEDATRAVDLIETAKLKGTTVDKLLEGKNPRWMTQEIKNIVGAWEPLGLEKAKSNLNFLLEAYDPYEAYRNLAGEVESRNVQGRMNMTPAEREATPFLETMDVPAERQIIRRGATDKMMSSEPKEFWQMTQKERIAARKAESEKYGGGFGKIGRQGAINRHRQEIENALSEGLPVPKEVLNDYPDLIKKSGKIQDFLTEMERLKS